MWVIDIRHWLNERQDGPAAPQLRLKVKKLGEIITWITSRDRGLPARDAPKCRRRPKRKQCKGILKIQFGHGVTVCPWQERRNALPVDMVALPLGPSPREVITNSGIYGALRDASPDYW